MKSMRLAAFIAVLGAAGAAQAGDAGYLGTWKIVRATVAPWAVPERLADTSERTRLMGKTISIKPHGITGPDPFACPGAHYRMTDYTPGLLFQGAFDEMRLNDKTVDPNKLAASLGFHGTHIKTLETGCEFDFHFVDPTTAEIGLNDYAYTLKKQ